ncbi:hypothetical protein FAY30_22620 [Bacillus sp. S3]|uniref:hypothetical protein n=1 Tax=Bacillus sp. S3 TaxID=486398 RepID=UPI00118C7649|nr:hypothetical protein [Bacillus sp. S3]QCJ44481.1 hypothetical protein FAY30_22620 [Bacillus sp. S3]
MKEIKKEWSVKLALFESEYTTLQDLASEIDITVKKLVNKSIKLALKDYEKKHHIKRSSQIRYVEDTELRTYSFKIKEKHYEKLKGISDSLEMNVKEIVKCILSYYPNVVVKAVEAAEEAALEEYYLK